MHLAKITRPLGWAAALIAFVYKALSLTSAGARVAGATTITPRHFLEASLLLFVICIAEVAYALGEEKQGSRAAGATG